MGIRHPLTLLALAASLTFPAVAKAEPAIDVTIKDHRFTPSEIHVPAGKPATLNIKNEDAAAEEFDSSALKVEKVIGGGKEGAVRLRPLDPGRYPFVGEYHEDTAQGVVIAE
jgi:plastocyanin